MNELTLRIQELANRCQAILDAIDSGRITNAEVSLVISNNPNAYALERAKNHGIEAVCISPKEFENREEFHKALLKKLQEKCFLKHR